MTGEHLTDLPASVRQRLYNLARQRMVDYNSLLVRFALERLLFRLGRSPLSGRFVIKGAMLFVAWTDSPHRSTRDLDLLGFGDISPDILQGAFRQILASAVPEDGLRFDAGSIRVDEVRDQQEYGGFRVTMRAFLGSARIPLQIDIGVGDSVVPQPEMITYPTLLQFPPPQVRAYTRESLIAEKLHALVTLGIINSRMKDFSDIWALSRSFAFDGMTLVGAIRGTFERRKTALPVELPAGLTEEFASDQLKQVQWAAFREKLGEGTTAVGLPETVGELREFLWPVLREASGSGVFEARWNPGTGWRTLK